MEEPQRERKGHLHIAGQVVVVAVSGREIIGKIFEIAVIPPREGVDPEFLEEAEYGEKGGHADNQPDEVFEPGPGAYRVDHEVVDNDVGDEHDRGPEA